MGTLLTKNLFQNMFYYCILIFSIFISLTAARSSGAPSEACSIGPANGWLDQTGMCSNNASATVFDIGVSQTTYNPNGSIQFTVTAPQFEQVKFKGLLIFLRAGGTTVGQFSGFDETKMKYGPCGGTTGKSLTHRNANEVRAQKFVWTAPSVPGLGPIRITAIIVGDRSSFNRECFYQVIQKDLTEGPPVAETPQPTPGATPNPTPLPTPFPTPSPTPPTQGVCPSTCSQSFGVAGSQHWCDCCGCNSGGFKQACINDSGYCSTKCVGHSGCPSSTPFPTPFPTPSPTPAPTPSNSPVPTPMSVCPSTCSQSFGVVGSAHWCNCCGCDHGGSKQACMANDGFCTTRCAGHAGCPAPPPSPQTAMPTPQPTPQPTPPGGACPSSCGTSFGTPGSQQWCTCCGCDYVGAKQSCINNDGFCSTRCVGHVGCPTTTTTPPVTTTPSPTPQQTPSPTPPPATCPSTCGNGFGVPGSQQWCDCCGCDYLGAKQECVSVNGYCTENCAGHSGCPTAAPTPEPTPEPTPAPTPFPTPFPTPSPPTTTTTTTTATTTTKVTTTTNPNTNTNTTVCLEACDVSFGVVGSELWCNCCGCNAKGARNECVANDGYCITTCVDHFDCPKTTNVAPTSTTTADPGSSSTQAGTSTEETTTATVNSPVTSETSTSEQSSTETSASATLNDLFDSQASSASTLIAGSTLFIVLMSMF